MTRVEVKSLTSYPPGLTASQVHEATGLTEHSRRQVERDGLLTPLSIGAKRIYPRHQVFALLGMVDPDVAAADAARELVLSELGRSEAPTVMADASDVLATSPRATEGGWAR